MRTDHVEIRTMAESDLDGADAVLRSAFGTFLGVDDVFGDRQYVRPRWRAAPANAVVATRDGELVGSNFVANWGSLGCFGPLSVRPDLWDNGIAQALMMPTMALFEEWGTRVQGLFTFATSAKHLALYQSYGFWPGHLTAMLETPVTAAERPTGTLLLSASGDPDELVAGCRAVTDRIYDGLDLQVEIDGVASQGLGDTVIVDRGGEPVAFAVCHTGAGSEAGSGNLYVKFAAAECGSETADAFLRLTEGCRALAADRGCDSMVVGVNTARVEAYRSLLAHGFRIGMTGVAMLRGADPGYNRPDAYVIDDWR